MSTLLPDRPAPGAPCPLDLAAFVGAAGWQRLPAAVQRRFAAAHHNITYTGELTLHCSRTGRLFAWVSSLLGGPLTTSHGQVPARVCVYGDGQGAVVWERHLALRGHDRVVRSRKLAADNVLVERTDGGLSMELDVFEADGALVFRSRRYFFDIAGRQLPIPAALTPGTCRVEHRDLGAGRFSFELSMVHPWWGTTFRQSGVFHDPKEVCA